MPEDTPFQAAKKASVYLSSALRTSQSYLANPRGEDVGRDFSDQINALSQMRKNLAATHGFSEGADHSAPPDVLAALSHAEWECTNVVIFSDVKKYTDLESALIGIRRDLATAGAPSHPPAKPTLLD